MPLKRVSKFYLPTFLSYVLSLLSRFLHHEKEKWNSIFIKASGEEYCSEKLEKSHYWTLFWPHFYYSSSTFPIQGRYILYVRNNHISCIILCYSIKKLLRWLITYSRYVYFVRNNHTSCNILCYNKKKTLICIIQIINIKNFPIN